jgi:RNA-directed DNA polymerase
MRVDARFKLSRCCRMFPSPIIKDTGGGLVRKVGYTHIPVPPGLPMLTSKRTRRIQRKADWYSSKVRVHFDRPLSREDAERLVTDPAAIVQHAFLPLISFQKKERRYRRRQGDAKPVASTKVRELAYPSNHDGYVFGFYAERLGILYEAELRTRGLDKVVIGYRKGSSNIKLARDAFSEIQTRGNCVALGLDIKGFFDNISHVVLKHAWASLLCGGPLPEDHYKVFRALAVAGKVDRGELLRRLDFPANARDRELPRPLCSIIQFHDLRSGNCGSAKLVTRHVADKGIPQGTPLSAMAANMSMLEFDTAVHGVVSAAGGSYRRYSDDILVLCPPEHLTDLEAAIGQALTIHTKTLSFNGDKREEVRFALPGPNLVPCPPATVAKPLQYLGFTFDGRRAFVRSGTLSRYYRRMASSVRVARARAWLAKDGKLKGRDVVHKREVLASHSHLGPRSFVSSYAKISADTMGPSGASIRRQLSRHLDVLNRRLDGKS